jgi:hypothetical protein
VIFRAISVRQFHFDGSLKYYYRDISSRTRTRPRPSRILRMVSVAGSGAPRAAKVLSSVRRALFHYYLLLASLLRTHGIVFIIIR